MSILQWILLKGLFLLMWVKIGVWLYPWSVGVFVLWLFVLSGLWFLDIRRQAEISRCLRDVRRGPLNKWRKNIIQRQLQAERTRLGFWWWLFREAWNGRKAPKRMFLGELMDDGPPWVRKSIQNTLWLAEQRLFPFILKGFLPPLWDKIVQIASSKEVVFLLELGCGHCGLLAKLAQRCKSSGIPCVFVAVDVEPSAIEGSKNKLLARGFSVHLAERLEEVDLARLAGLAKREKNPIICLVQADVYKLEKVFAPDVIFDFAWLHHFFHHLPDEGARSLIGEVEGFATSWYVLEELRQWLPLFLIHIFIWYFPAHLETAVNSILAEKTKQEWKDEWPGTEMCTKGFLVFINNAVELPVAVDETKLVIVGK